MSLRHLIEAGFFEKKKKTQQLVIVESATGGDSFSVPAAPVTKIGLITPAG